MQMEPASDPYDVDSNDGSDGGDDKDTLEPIATVLEPVSIPCSCGSPTSSGWDSAA